MCIRDSVGRYDVNGVSVGVVNFQAKLFEQDSSIHFIYGDMTGASDWSQYSTTSIGMNSEGNPSTEFISVTPDNVNGAPASSDVENDNILPETLILIESGTTYIFSPPGQIDEYDISVSDIISPVNGFLTTTDTVKIIIENLGNEITEGLTLTYEVYEINSGIQAGLRSTKWLK